MSTEPDSLRQTDRTTKQVREAPQDAIYIWVNSAMGYPRLLAQRLGRTDLLVVSPGWVVGCLSRYDRPLVVDHAAWSRLTERQYEEIRRYQLKMEARAPKSAKGRK